MSWTIGELAAGGYGVTAFCGSHRCARNRKGSLHRSSMKLELSRFPPDARLDQIRIRLRCTVCGQRMGRTIVSPDNAAGIGRPGLY